MISQLIIVQQKKKILNKVKMMVKIFNVYIIKVKSYKILM